MDTLLKIAAIGLCAVVLGGCTSVKLYPICFYDKKPSAAIVEKQYIPSLRKAFAEIMQGSPDQVIISPDARWIISNTTPDEDKKLLSMWPRIGCIGPAGSTSQVKLQSDCIAYMEKFLTERKYLHTGQYRGEGGASYYNESTDPQRLVYCSPQNE